MFNNQRRDIEYVMSHFNFEGVDWKQMVENSMKEHK
jgi:hypothetical protein